MLLLLFILVFGARYESFWFSFGPGYLERYKSFCSVLDRYLEQGMNHSGSVSAGYLEQGMNHSGSVSDRVFGARYESFWFSFGRVFGARLNHSGSVSDGYLEQGMNHSGSVSDRVFGARYESFGFSFDRVFGSKVYRVYDYYYIVESRTVYPNLWRVVNLVHILLIFAHWFGCFYFLLSQAEGFYGDWVYPYRVGEFSTLTRKYLGSIYWSTLTLTTIGDLPQPETDAE
ncbi:hypothetical protein WDU94_010196 [Cyamophila willieti]